MLLGQERALGELGMGAVREVLGEQQAQRAIEARRLAATTAAERAVEAATLREQRRAEAAEKAFERQKELKAIPPGVSPEVQEKREIDLELAKRKLERGEKEEALTANQRVMLSERVRTNEANILDAENIDNPSYKPDMDFVNQYGNKPYFYIQREVPGTLWGTNTQGEQISLPVAEIDGEQRQLTGSDIVREANKAGVTPEEVLRQLGLMR